MRSATKRTQLIGIGFLGGLLAGLLGVGGGIAIVPLLVIAAGTTQHEAHATSLAAIIPISAVAATRFGLAGEIDVHAAVFLACGTLVGAPVGARLMARTSEGTLKALFGMLAIVLGAVMLWG
jgi:uncharacterized membrane protein YfcA